MSEINNELNTLIATRNKIKQAIITKGQDVNNDIRTYDAAILEITTGTETEDATATASDIARGKSAYVKGEKVIGIAEPIAYQTKSITVEQDGIYSFRPDTEEGYNALQTVTVNVNVEGSKEPQHLPYYVLDQDDDGYLWCRNNYNDLLYVPYTIDDNGNLILLQDETDRCTYVINDNMELEVII